MFKFLSLILVLVASRLPAQDAFNLNLNGLKQSEAPIVNYKNSINALSVKRNLFLCYNDVPSCNNTITPINNAVKYEAFFCKLETRLHQHFNIWIKMRAGGDDMYRKMTDDGLK